MWEGFGSRMVRRLCLWRMIDEAEELDAECEGLVLFLKPMWGGKWEGGGLFYEGLVLFLMTRALVLFMNECRDGRDRGGRREKGRWRVGDGRGRMCPSVEHS